MSTNHLITANARNKTRMIIALVKQVEVLEQELSRVSSSPVTPDCSGDNLKRLIQAVAGGQVIETIKTVREMTGLGLFEAKELVASAGIKLVKAA